VDPAVGQDVENNAAQSKPPGLPMAQCAHVTWTLGPAKERPSAGRPVHVAGDGVGVRRTPASRFPSSSLNASTVNSAPSSPVAGLSSVSNEMPSASKSAGAIGALAVTDNVQTSVAQSYLSA